RPGPSAPTGPAGLGPRVVPGSAETPVPPAAPGACCAATGRSTERGPWLLLAWAAAARLRGWQYEVKGAKGASPPNLLRQRAEVCHEIRDLHPALAQGGERGKGEGRRARSVVVAIVLAFVAVVLTVFAVVLAIFVVVLAFLAVVVVTPPAGSGGRIA